MTMPQDKRSWTPAEILALLLVTFLAAYLRLDGITYGLGNMNIRSDEDFIIKQALGFFSGDLHPGVFYYPTLIVYLLFGLYAFLTPFFSGIFSTTYFVLDPAPATLVARIFIASFGIVAVPLLWIIGRRFFSRRTGAWSGLFLSVGYLAIREGHFAKLTAPTLFWFVVILGVSLWLLERKDGAPHLFAGLCVGLGASSFYTAGFAGTAVIAAILFREGGRGLWSRAFALVVIGSVAGFFVGTPYAILDPQEFYRSFVLRRYHYDFMGGAHDVLWGPKGYGLYHNVVFTLRYGMGLPLMLLSLASLVFLGCRALQKSGKRDGRAVVILGLFLPYYLLFGITTGLHIRYMAPLLPVLFLATAWFLDEVFSTKFPRRHFLAACVIFVMCFPPLITTFQFNAIMNRPDTRILAAEWINQNLPEGTSIYMYPSRGNPEPNPTRFRLIREAFTTADDLLAADPDMIIVEEYPWTIFSAFPPQLAPVLENYPHLIWSGVPCADYPEGGNPLFDRQDDFYLPYAHLEKFEFGGPALFVYARPTTVD